MRRLNRAEPSKTSPAHSAYCMSHKMTKFAGGTTNPYYFRCCRCCLLCLHPCTFYCHPFSKVNMSKWPLYFCRRCLLGASFAILSSDKPKRHGINVMQQQLNKSINNVCMHRTMAYICRGAWLVFAFLARPVAQRVREHKTIRMHSVARQRHQRHQLQCTHFICIAGLLVPAMLNGATHAVRHSQQADNGNGKKFGSSARTNAISKY